MDNILSLEDIMRAAKRPETTTMPIPEWGGSVKVKGFTREEVREIRKSCMETVGETEKLNMDRYEEALVMGALVEPAMTPEYWRQLQTRLPAGTERLVKAIVQASGLNPLSAKEAEQIRRQFPNGDGAAAGVPAGDAPGDDGGATPPGDA